MNFQAYPYQQYCIDRIVSDDALGLFLDMGLGKTVITLTAIDELRYKRWAVSRVLVIAPKKVAEATWSTEAAKWSHLKHLKIIPVLGTATRRVKALHTPADVWVINRENVPWLVDYYRNDWPFDMVVLDESSSFKNPQSKRFKALRLVRPRIKRLVELTGTPAPNGLIDLWAQIYLLDGGARLGRTLSQYRATHFVPDKRSRSQIFTYAPKSGAAETIRQMIGDICISMRAEDYITLPDYVEDDIPVALDASAAKRYRHLEREMILQIDEETVTAGSAAVLTNKLLQLCNGAVYNNSGEISEVHRCKLDACMETIEQLGGAKALVFYGYRHDLERLTHALSKTNLRVRAYKNADDADDWNAGEVDVLLAHPASCAFGLNLQNGGHHIIWFGLTWSLELYQQANKRLHRQGQAHPVIVHRLIVQGGVDEDVIAALRSKDGAQESLLQALRARIGRAVAESARQTKVR